MLLKEAIKCLNAAVDIYTDMVRGSADPGSDPRRRGSGHDRNVMNSAWMFLLRQLFVDFLHLETEKNP